MPSYKFYKSERLNNKKRLEAIFSSGSSINAYPIKLIYRTEPPSDYFPSLQFAFSIPKRSFKKAVHRNSLRRKLKEAFRLHKHLLYEHLEKKNTGVCVYGMFIYIDKEKTDYHSIEKKMIQLIQKLIHKL